MKGIGTVLRRDKSKPKHGAKFWAGLALISIMILSSFAFILDFYGNQQTTEYPYGNYTFSPDPSGGWKTTINGRDLVFSYTPDTLEYLNTSIEAANIIRNTRVLWIAYDPLNEYSDIMGGVQYVDEFLLRDGMSIYVQRGLTNNTLYPELPQISCANASTFEPVLLITQHNETPAGVTTQGSCIILSGTYGEDLIRANERLLFSVLGVMNP